MEEFQKIYTVAFEQSQKEAEQARLESEQARKLREKLEVLIKLDNTLASR